MRALLSGSAPVGAPPSGNSKCPGGMKLPSAVLRRAAASNFGEKALEIVFSRPRRFSEAAWRKEAGEPVVQAPEQEKFQGAYNRLKQGQAEGAHRGNTVRLIPRHLPQFNPVLSFRSVQLLLLFRRQYR